MNSNTAHYINEMRDTFWRQIENNPHDIVYILAFPVPRAYILCI